MNSTLKVAIVTCLLIFFTHNSYCQINTLDSLQSALSNTSDPIKKFELLDKILLAKVGFTATNVDSASAVKLVAIAQQLKNDSLLAISYNWIGSYFSSNKGDNTTGLEYYFKALPLAIKAQDKRRISSLYFDIALSYFNLKNNDAAHSNNLKGGENLPDISSPMYVFMLVQFQMNESQYFLSIDQNDSALFYAEQLRNTNAQLGSFVMEYTALIYRAAAQARMGNNILADELFSSALAVTDSIGRNQARMEFYRLYIPFLLSEHRATEAKRQAKTLLNHGISIDNNQFKLLGATFLRQIYADENRIDSAYFYSRMEAEVNELIFSQNNKNKIQALVFNEQLRATEERNKETEYRNEMKQYGLLTGLGVFLLLAFILFRNNWQKQKTNEALSRTLSDLKSTQSQLIQSEKMASLGELTAGIAHEIQNPLNFVNNFSEVSNELIDEMTGELEKGDVDEAKVIAKDVKQNLEKISHHGKRAADIVKGMLQHSRASSGQKEPTDINALCDEYLRLSYHGLRAKDKSFNAKFETDFDDSLLKINVVPQDIGRVVLNLINNAFYTVQQKEKELAAGLTTFERLSTLYEPTVTVSTKKEDNKVFISVKDNGNGIPQNIVDKIFQPFFTTKPTGQGTGLGLSLSYDIVKAHGGELKVETKEGEGTIFVIQLPSNSL